MFSLGNSLNLENPNVLVSQKQRSETTQLALRERKQPARAQQRTHVMSRLDKYDEAAIERVVRDQQIERDRVLIERLNGCYEQEWMYHYNIAYDLARDRDYTCDEAEAYANELADKAVEELKERLKRQIRDAEMESEWGHTMIDLTSDTSSSSASVSSMSS